MFAIYADVIYAMCVFSVYLKTACPKRRIILIFIHLYWKSWFKVKKLRYYTCKSSCIF